jgi:hypothetical protein
MRRKVYDMLVAEKMLVQGTTRSRRLHMPKRPQPATGRLRWPRTRLYNFFGLPWFVGSLVAATANAHAEPSPLRTSPSSGPPALS